MPLYFGIRQTALTPLLYSNLKTFTKELGEGLIRHRWELHSRTYRVNKHGHLSHQAKINKNKNTQTKTRSPSTYVADKQLSFYGYPVWPQRERIHLTWQTLDVPESGNTQGSRSLRGEGKGG